MSFYFLCVSEHQHPLWRCSQATGGGTLAGAVLSGQTPACNLVKIRTSELSEHTDALTSRAGVRVENSQKWMEQTALTYRIHSLIPPSSLSTADLAVSQRNGSNENRISTTASTTTHSLPLSVPIYSAFSPATQKGLCSCEKSMLVLLH